MTRVKKLGYKPNEEEVKALSGLSRRKTVTEPSLHPHPPTLTHTPFPPHTHTYTHTHTHSPRPLPPPPSLPPVHGRRRMTRITVCCTGMALWSTVWGSAACLSTFQVLRKLHPAGGWARPLTVGCAAGVWAAGFRVQAFPVSTSFTRTAQQEARCWLR